MKRLRARFTRKLLHRSIAALALALAAGFWASSATAQDDDKPAEKAKPKKAQFSHSDHADLDVAVKNCNKCHTLDDNYRALAPTAGKDHQPCANSDCHFQEFFSAKPMICTVCHESPDPRVQQKAILRQRPRSEFAGSGLSHKSHLAMGSKKGNAACMRCHGDKYSGQNKPKTGGHSACSSCHGRNAEPRMTKCGGCHATGGEGDKKPAKPSEWNVRATFTHDSHGRDPRRSSPTSCVTCHRGIPKATTLDSIKAPKMQFCDACHDGEHAFKTTGFACFKCHSNQK